MYLNGHSEDTTWRSQSDRAVSVVNVAIGRGRFGGRAEQGDGPVGGERRESLHHLLAGAEHEEVGDDVPIGEELCLRHVGGGAVVLVGGGVFLRTDGAGRQAQCRRGGQQGTPRDRWGP